MVATITFLDRDRGDAEEDPLFKSEPDIEPAKAGIVMNSCCYNKSFPPISEKNNQSKCKLYGCQAAISPGKSPLRSIEFLPVSFSVASA